MLASVRASGPESERLRPPADARVAIDRHYVFAACGALASVFPADRVVALMRESIG
jgi:hypothetical protein